jgi:plasmid stability protein
VTHDDLIVRLRSARFRYSNEAELQEAIAAHLGTKRSEREVTLAANARIDFLIGDVGIEVKIGGSPAEIFRQLMRYAQLPQVASFVVVTDKKRIVNGLPLRVLGKPLDVVSLAESSL